MNEISIVYHNLLSKLTNNTQIPIKLPTITYKSISTIFSYFIGLTWSEKTFLMSTPKHLGDQIFRFTWVKLMIDPHPQHQTFLMSTPKCLEDQIFRFTQVTLTIDPPVSNCHNSFTWYTALHSMQLYTVIWCSATGQMSHTFLNLENFCQFPGVVVVLLIAYCCCCCCELHNNNNHNYQININWFLGNNYEVFAK